MRKTKILGCLTGLALMASFTVGAMGSKVDGTLYHRNPITGAPQGKAWTMAPKGKILAKVTATKPNYSIRTKTSESTGPGTAETGWLSGPTYKAAGTKFVSLHRGYNSKGKREILTASYQFK